MKRQFGQKIAAMLIIVLLFCGINTYANGTISVNFNGNGINFDVQPCIIDNRTLVPVRGVFEAIGAEIAWDSNAKLISAKKGTTSVWLQVNNPIMTVSKNGVISCTALDVPPCIVDDRTLVPVRAVSEAFDAVVSWDNVNRQVVIRCNAPSEIPAPVSGDALPEDIALSGFSAPGTIFAGNSYPVEGNVSTDSLLDRVNVKVTDTATGKVEINETQFAINSSSYSLTEIDNRIKFGILGLGAKSIQITAVTVNEYKKTFSFDFSVVTPPVHTQLMLWPVPSSDLITTVFWCENVNCHSNGGRPNGHGAIDIAAPQGSAVLASGAGVVTFTGFGDAENGYGGYGNCIVIDHGNGIVTQYSHLYEIYVSVGDYVNVGATIGGVGSTGNSTGNHLDFNIKVNGVRSDPLYYLKIPSGAHCSESCDEPYLIRAMQTQAN